MCVRACVCEWRKRGCEQSNYETCPNIDICPYIDKWPNIENTRLGLQSFKIRMPLDASGYK